MTTLRAATNCFRDALSQWIQIAANMFGISRVRYEGGAVDEISSGARTMNETVQQYIQRMTSYAEGKPPLAVQAATAKTLERSAL
jgi:hypothetical protein